MNKTLILTVGLPQSGKSTYSLNISKERGWPIVNPDSIRLAFYNQPFIKECENWIWTYAKTMVETLFITGYEYVILDATNITKKDREFWKNDKWNIKYFLFNTQKNICIERCLKNKKEYLIPIIEKMNDKIEFFKFDSINSNDDIIYVN